MTDDAKRLNELEQPNTITRLNELLRASLDDMRLSQHDALWLVGLARKGLESDVSTPRRALRCRVSR